MEGHKIKLWMYKFEQNHEIKKFIKQIAGDVTAAAAMAQQEDDDKRAWIDSGNHVTQP